MPAVVPVGIGGGFLLGTTSIVQKLVDYTPNVVPVVVAGYYFLRWQDQTYYQSKEAGW